MKPVKVNKKISKTLVVLVFVAGLSLGGYFVLQSGSSRADLTAQLGGAFSAEALKDDLDFDGLKDWEEKIYKTSATNADTDGDGYLDGEEVAAGYDPTKKAPDDQLAVSNDAQKLTARPEPGNLTQALGYLLSSQIQFDPTLLTNIDSSRALEQVIDEQVAKALQKASAWFLAEFIPPFQKENTELKTTDQNDLTTIREYARQARDQIGQLESCQDLGNSKGDAEFIQEMLETKNFASASCLSASYLRAYQELAQISVPLDWLDIHKKFLQIFWRNHKTYQFLPQYEQDPLKGMVLLETFEQTSKDFMTLLKEMQADLNSRQL